MFVCYKIFLGRMQFVRVEEPMFVQNVHCLVEVLSSSSLGLKPAAHHACFPAGLLAFY